MGATFIGALLHGEGETELLLPLLKEVAKAGHTVRVHVRSEWARESARGWGARVVTNVDEACGGAAAVLTGLHARDQCEAAEHYRHATTFIGHIETFLRTQMNDRHKPGSRYRATLQLMDFALVPGPLFPRYESWCAEYGIESPPLALSVGAPVPESPRFDSCTCCFREPDVAPDTNTRPTIVFAGQHHSTNVDVADVVLSEARRLGVGLVALPHPKDADGLKKWAERKRVSYVDQGDMASVLRVLRGARVVATEYSSIGWQATLHGKPVIYHLPHDDPPQMGELARSYGFENVWQTHSRDELRARMQVAVGAESQNGRPRRLEPEPGALLERLSTILAAY